MTLPQNFPVGNIQLSKSLNRMVRGNPLSRQIPLMAPYSGPVPRWSGGSSVDEVRHTLDARKRGTLSELVAAKGRPTDVRSQQPPQLSTESLPPEVATDPKVQSGSGSTRDAAPAGGASL